MAEANKRKRDDGAIKTLFSNYAEVVFYECMFSAQFTANIQILFRIDDIVLKLPPDSFAARFPEIKQKALEKIQKNVNDWKRSLDPTTMAFFDTNDLSKAIAVVAQKGTLNVTFSDKVIKLPVKDTSISCIMAAIDLLRYPLARMETIQSNRQGALLDLEKDATFITAMHDDCTIQADKILHSLELLQTDSMPKRPKKSEKADK